MACPPAAGGRGPSSWVSHNGVDGGWSAQEKEKTQSEWLARSGGCAIRLMVARREARLHQAKPAGVLELNAVHVAKKIDDGLRTGEQREIARDDDALETG